MFADYRLTILHTHVSQLNNFLFPYITYNDNPDHDFHMHIINWSLSMLQKLRPFQFISVVRSLVWNIFNLLQSTTILLNKTIFIVPWNDFRNYDSTLLYSTPDHTRPHHTLLYFTLLYFTLLYFTLLYYTILYYTILYYTILYYTILYYTILYYTILYYTILYYTF